MNPVIILVKRELLKIVLDARNLNSLIDESKCNWPIEPIQIILTKIKVKYFTTADINSAYNQMTNSSLLEINRIFYEISIQRTSIILSIHE